MFNHRAIFFALFATLVLTTPHVYAQAPTCYAAPGGDDANDGSYWAFAKADLMACYDALPSAGGTIFFRDSGVKGQVTPACKATDPPGCGIWIMSPSDPNYSRPPAGWRRVKGPVAFIGMGGTESRPFNHGGQAGIVAGGKDPDHPAIWLSGALSITFQNLAPMYACVPARIGIDSTGNRSRPPSASWNLYFQNVALNALNYPGCGPGVDIGSTSSWNFFKDSQFNGNPLEYVKLTTLARDSNTVTATASSPLPSSWANGMTLGIVGAVDASFNGGNLQIRVTGSNSFTFSQPGPEANSTGGFASSDRAQAVVMNPGTTGGSGLTFIQDSFFGLGGVKLYPGLNGEEVHADNILQEGGVAPVVWFAGCVAPTIATVRNVTIADALGNYAAVRADCPSNPQNFASSIVVEGASVDGPATLLGGTSRTDMAESPLLGYQQGIINGHLEGQTDAARRGFGPVAARFPNLASQVPANWRLRPGVSLAPTSAPDGTGNAAEATVSHPGTFDVTLAARTQLVSSGGILICGAWVRSLNPPGYATAATNPLSCGLTAVTATSTWKVSQGSAQTANGEWDWVWQVFKLGAVSGPNGLINLAVNLSSSKGIGIYAPVLMYLPSGAMADNEAVEYAESLQTYRDDAVPGQVSLLRGEQFKADSIQVGDGPTITSGLGAPKDPATPGSLYLRRDGASGSTLYIYQKDAWKAQF
jgi:hypothetical protein